MIEAESLPRGNLEEMESFADRGRFHGVDLTETGNG